MPSRLTELVSKRLATPPHGIDQLIQYEVYMGSLAYGCSDDSSDLDVYGFCIGPKDTIFPHTSGFIFGFDNNPKGFDTYTQHGIVDKNALGETGREYDYSIHNITKFFKLVAGNNPNMIDSLYVPNRCILHMTPIGLMVRENRSIFLSKKCIHTFRGYAWEQLHKLRTKEPTQASKRRALIEKFGFDVKFAYHIVRLLSEVEQLLTEGDMDLERDREIYKAIRRGDWTLEELEEYFKVNEARLIKVAEESKLPHSPDMRSIKKLLVSCLEQHFGNLQDCLVVPGRAEQTLKDVEKIINNYKGAQ